MRLLRRRSIGRLKIRVLLIIVFFVHLISGTGPLFFLTQICIYIPSLCFVSHISNIDSFFFILL
jgi:hypothetical protein